MNNKIIIPHSKCVKLNQSGAKYKNNRNDLQHTKENLLL